MRPDIGCRGGGRRGGSVPWAAPANLLWWPYYNPIRI